MEKAVYSCLKTKKKPSNLKIIDLTKNYFKALIYRFTEKLSTILPPLL